MKGDFTRDTFDPLKHFSRVLMQQGRVTLDADFNEQAAIELRYLHTLARDVIGPYAAPAGADGGFLLAKDPKSVFTISKGRYYVDGLLVENDIPKCTYQNQPDFSVPDDDALLAALKGEAQQAFGIYLDVWERHITRIEDDSIREKALGGPDTCTRAKVVWQVKALLLSADMQKEIEAAKNSMTASIDKLYTRKAELEKKFQAAASTDTKTQIALLKELQPVDEQLARLIRFSQVRAHEKFLSHLVRIGKASLAARVDPGVITEDACVTPPDSKYRGAENQLYRVEIHRGGKAGEATFKWSRDNGSLATAWLGGEGSDLQVASARGFAAGDWVELSDDTSDLLGNPGVLVQLVKVEGDALSVDPATTLPERSDYPVNPRVRRWNQIATEDVTLIDGAMSIQESATNRDLWIDLEDGVQIQFSAGGEYRTGDYWLIPARVATGSVEWPQDDKLKPRLLPPRGIEHHYALLGFASWANEKLNIENARFEFWPLLSDVAQSSLRPGPIRVVGAGAKPDATKAAPTRARKPRKRRAKTATSSPAEGPPS